MRTSDPTIDEIRRVRHEISREVDHDPKRLVEYYRRLEKQHRDRLLTTVKEETPL